MSEHPDPLVPAEVDLRDFAFMPLDVARLRDSDLASDETPEACWAAVLLWCASWHQVPAASVPDNDQWLAKACGYVSRGRIDPQWAKVRDGALHGWVLCSDGRRYHPVVAEKAREAWRSKLEQRWRTECARIKKHAQRHGTTLPIPDFDQWVTMGCPQGQPLPVPGDKPPPSPGTRGRRPQDVPGETASKGQGERDIPPKAPPSPSPSPSTTAEPEPDDPPWLPADAWSGYLAMRKAKQRKAPFTPRARSLVLAELERLKAQGQDLAAVLDQSVRNGWTDVYPVKAPMRANGASASVIAHPSSATVDEATMRRISDAHGGLAVERLPDGRYRCGVHYFRPDGRREVLA